MRRITTYWQPFSGLPCTEALQTIRHIILPTSPFERPENRCAESLSGPSCRASRQDSSLDLRKLSLLARYGRESMPSSRFGGSPCASRTAPGPQGVPSTAWRECHPASRTHILTAFHTELLEDCARRGGGDGAEQQPHEQKRCQGFSQQRANMSQQRAPLPSTLMGSSAALIEGECLR